MEQERQSNIPHYRGRGLRRGVTLVELVVALSIAGIVTGLVLFSWSFVSRHTTQQKRKALLYSQTENLIGSIVNEVRASSQIVSYGDDSIVFISSKSNDTVSYSRTADTLYRKGAAVHLVSQCSKVVRFSIEIDEEASGNQYDQQLSKGEQPDIVLVITLGVEDCFGASSVIPQKVKVHQPDDATLGNASKWNF
jgi:prepilin-type N-terminal cleavage/methylation domain-containing protein